MGALSTLWRVTLIGLNKASEKWLQGNKNLREMLISITYVIKYDAKVGKLVFV